MENDPASSSEGQTTTTITATTHLTLPAHPTPLTYEQLNPKSPTTDFFGPYGTLFVSVMCPIISYFLFFACNESTGCHPTSVSAWKEVASGMVGGWKTSSGKLWDWKAVGVYLAWYFFCVVCWIVLPGEKVQGTLMRDGKRKTYTMNGFYTLVLALGISLGVVLQPGGIELYTWLYDHWVPLTSAALAMAAIQATWVYAYSYFSGELLALGGNSGVFIYDWFLGRPLNPTVPGFPSFDIKTFNEVRPGIIGWDLLNISCACEQYLRLGRVTDSMWLVLAFEGWYTFDSLWQESAILNQMDITTDGFGFMLAFGDLVWVPFVYNIQARFLTFHPIDLGLTNTALILVVKLAGVYIFRQSNQEKHDFRNGRNPKNLTFMQTERGTKLLTSGWWGLSRHPNYFGDWLMALSWSLPTGFNTPITYFYLAFFVVLLLHRRKRDDEMCRHKYGKDWDKYCELVPWKIIPYVY